MKPTLGLAFLIGSPAIAWVTNHSPRCRRPALILFQADELASEPPKGAVPGFEVTEKEVSPAPIVREPVNGASQLSTFREAEVLGLRLMQEGKFDDALQAFQTGLKLPGSRPDVIRSKLLSGPSPVGGAMGGFESSAVLTLDEFELQAAHYNMACAYAQLGNVQQAVANLQTAFDNGFDNYATVRGDPDLKPLQGTEEFEELMEQYDSQKGFNPFGLFGKK